MTHDCTRRPALAASSARLAATPRARLAARSRRWTAALRLASLLAVCLLGQGAAAACELQPTAAGSVPLLRGLDPSCDEDALLGPGRRPRLYALADGSGHYQRQRPAAVLVHGLAGHPADLAAVGAQLGRAGYQVYALFFDDMGQHLRENGAGLAAELGRYFGAAGRSPRRLAVVAHSAGGLLARLALNLLSAAGQLRRFEQVQLYAIDTPWHGYRGPSDATSFGRLRMRFVDPFMPNGLKDLRAESVLFSGDPSSENPALARGLLRYALPPQVQVYLCFAEQGDQVHDYTEGLLRPLSAQIARYYREAQPVRGSAQLQNFWHALISTDAYFGFQEELRGLADSGRLDAGQVEQALRRHYPRFAGNHVTILHAATASEAGQSSLLSQLLPTLHGGREPELHSAL